jgi:hypothetical protein
MTINGLFVETPQQLALPRQLPFNEAVRHFPYHSALADVTSISLDSMRAQVMVIVDPSRIGVGVTTYGDPRLADTVCIDSRGGHLALSNQIDSSHASAPYKVLIVLTVPSKMSLRTSTKFRGMIGVGGMPGEYLNVALDGTSWFYVECMRELCVVARDSSIAEVGTVTEVATVQAADSAKIITEQVYGRVNCIARNESKIDIQGGIASSGSFMAENQGEILHGGVIAGSASVEQRGTGLLSIKEVRSKCSPRVVSTGSVSINGTIHTN